ncbi:MAG TPA: hypothetical protein VN281_01680 [Verrucomicrobiae bacterium]|nr:hypothetical protein [Verrucomicrobiae bacterium]
MFAVAILINLLSLGISAAGAAGKYLKLDVAASSNTNELQVPVTYTLWIPDGVARLRAIIVHQHGAGTTASIEGSTAAYDLHWQALAVKGDCALMSSSYHVTNEKIDLSPGGSELWFDPRHGSEKTFLKALSDFAAASGHPEIETVPWALWGHSGGGIWSDVLACLHPDRVAVMWLRSGSAAMFRTKPEFPQPDVPDAIYSIPIMCNSGVKEQRRGPWVGPLATFQEFRLHGAPIGFAPDPRTDHECGDSRYLAIPFIDACLAMRLSDPGSTNQPLKPIDMSQAWLAPLMSDDAKPAAQFKGNPNVAVWLPNEAVARAWMQYVKTGAVNDTTPPPAPYDVTAAPKGEQGTEITWKADADFESGIRCFIIMRDGRQLAQVPEKPVGKFGRPLFQSMTYHDTPSQPLPEMRYLDASAKPGEKHSYAAITVNSVELKSPPCYARPGGYQFDTTISREVLENYLSRSITMQGMLTGRGDLKENIRMLKSCGAKYIGRALCLWGAEANFLHDVEQAKEAIPRVLAADPEMVLEACVFETVGPKINDIAIPDWVFTTLGQPVEKRNFRYDDIIYPEGQRRPMGRNAQVPDESRPETQLWFYYQAATYIDIGCEAIHFGQVELMNKNDRDNAKWAHLLDLVRKHAAAHARRHMIICNGHVPSGGLMHDGKPLLDFHAFPLRIMEVADKPHEAILKVGHSDGIYNRSKGGQTFSGWTCDHLPYLVEFDNYGVSRYPGEPNTEGKSIWVWGYDEITWFAHQTKDYRGNWLRYAWDWVRTNDLNGHLEMPGSRTATSPDTRWYFANNPGPQVPNGLGDEEAIRDIWLNDSAASGASSSSSVSK